MLYPTLDAKTPSLNRDNADYSHIVTDIYSRDHIYKPLGTKVCDMHIVDKYGKLKQCQIWPAQLVLDGEARESQFYPRAPGLPSLAGQAVIGNMKFPSNAML